MTVKIPLFLFFHDNSIGLKSKYDKTDPVGQTNYQVVLAITYVLTLIGKSSDVVSMLVTTFDRKIPKDWSNCLDRRQVWNQKRPPWFEALHHTIYPLLTPIVNILVSSMQTGATIYQVCVKLNFHLKSYFI